MSEPAAESDVWTIRRVIAWAADDLKKRSMPSPRLDVELLLGHVLKVNRIGLVIDAERPLSKEELGSYRALHMRRRGGEPVSYLLGVREFYGREFRVERRVLIPRPDTETLVEVALERTRALSLSARVLDLCTGSGCVAITIARERPTMRVTGSDISPGALTVARENSIRLGAATIGLVQSDLLAGFEAGRDRFDLITANPPYIADEEIPALAVDIHRYEPRLALSGGADGLDLVRRILAEAPRFLAAGGVLAMEIGAGQSPDVMALFAEAGFGDITAQRDYGGHERVVSGVRG